MTNPDASTIDICRQLLVIEHEREVLVERDPEAPDSGPYHEPHEALQAQWLRLAAALTKAPPPTTPAGIKAVAQLAMTSAERTAEGELCPPNTFGDWLRLLALTSAVGSPRRSHCRCPATCRTTGPRRRRSRGRRARPRAFIRPPLRG